MITKETVYRTIFHSDPRIKIHRIEDYGPYISITFDRVYDDETCFTMMMVDKDRCIIRDSKGLMVEY